MPRRCSASTRGTCCAGWATATTRSRAWRPTAPWWWALATERRVVLRPIGFVANGERGPRHEGWAEVVSRLVLQPELAAALDGVEGFSHLLVLFWLDRVTRGQRWRLRVYPRDRRDLPEVGVLATRTQQRPNPIGATVVALLGREGTTLVVRGLDALDGTPVLDVKPWAADFGPTEGVRVPEWWERLRTASP
ncbi:MAG: tRNA (N6-threonylcarbamoyladenosine(37)-N6)-methyltransferase TrmO [Chloroflexi bacterium]|nr:tRNA (N6-threonylcarbamoyladenosine(37)-N6)-methyltransferase TrmO [Chloroflexota bacterium]